MSSRSRRRHLALLALALAPITAPQPAHAHEATQSAATSAYPNAFYANFHPQTALDMLKHTPGFSLNEGGDARGFSGVSGNVLINGQRPTAKDDSLEDVLSRISAAQVDRIEIVRGADLAEARGQSVVANVITLRGVNSGAYALGATHDGYSGALSPSAEFSQSGWLGPWSWSRGLNITTNRDQLHGTTVSRDGADDPIESARDRYHNRNQDFAATGSGAGPLGGGVLSLNGRLGYTDDESSHDEFDAESAFVLRNGFSRAQGWSAEFGADWLRALSEDWSLKLISLFRYGENDYDDALIEGGDATLYVQEDSPLELVAGFHMASDEDTPFRPEFGGEFAYNRLTTEAALLENGAPVALPGANTEVSERRAELFGSLTTPIGEDWRVTTRLSFESSMIEVTGDNTSSQSLQYWKPSLLLTRSFGDDTQLRIDFTRSVSQLDFSAFAASVNLDDSRPLFGNAVLRPEVDTWVSIAFDHTFAEEGALTASLMVGEFDDALAYLPLEGGGEALINSTPVPYWIFETSATLPLDDLLANAQLTLSGAYGESERDDPLTNGRRDAGWIQPYWAAEFRHDLPAFNASYGFSYESDAPLREWYVAEAREVADDPYWTAFVERSFTTGFKATLTLSGLVRDHEARVRTFFDPDRSGAVVGSERRSTDRGMSISLRLARSFP